MSKDVIETILATRYYAENEHSWSDVCARVANFIGKTEDERKEYYRLMNDCKFLPNSPTLFNAGVKPKCLSACFVMDVEDSIESIFEAIKRDSLVFQSGGGVGHSFGKLRPRNSPVSSGGVSSGVISFMRVFDAMISSISAGGKRRGAAMGILPVNHGDILDFLQCKTKEGEIKNFNLSVMVTDEFMKLVCDKKWDVVITHYINDNNEKIPITCGEIWKGIIEGSWRNGEPACLFEDTINRGNTMIKLGRITATNPCFTGDCEILTDKGYQKFIDVCDKEVNVWNGAEWSLVIPKQMGENEDVFEITFSNGMKVKATGNHRWFTVEGVKQTNELNENKDKLISLKLPDGGFCGDCFVESVKLYGKENVYCCIEPKRNQIIVNGVPTSNCAEQPLLPDESCNLGSINLSKYVIDGKFDYEALRYDVGICVDFLNGVIDKNNFPLKNLKEMSDKTRKIGLGIMGLHDALIKLRIPYDSQDGLDFATEVLKLIQSNAIMRSHDLALRDGVFPAFKDSNWNIEMRNAALMTVAPTGSLSLLAQCSSGIEPVFNWVYMRKNTVGKEFLMVHPLFDADLKVMCDGDEKLYNKIIEQVFRDGTLQHVDCIPDKVKKLYKCALDIKPEWHVKMQAECQKYVDSGISKTINLPNNATIEDIEKIFIDAWKLGCKGITVYRTGSRKDVVLSSGGEDKNGFLEVVKNGKMLKKCPDCGFEFEADVGGCLTCPECGYTHCGA